MGKLGKKARKFAKKHLQSVLRNRRKTKAFFKKKAPKIGRDGVEEQRENIKHLSAGRNTTFESVDDISLDAVFSGNELSGVADLSESDGYLSEDSSSPYVGETEAAKAIESDFTKQCFDEDAASFYSSRNEKIRAKLARQDEKLKKLRKKDLAFSKHLESFSVVENTFQNSDEDEGEPSDQAGQGEIDVSKAKGRVLTNQVITTWFHMAKEENNIVVISSLLNAYRAVCHYGAEDMLYTFQNSETFYGIILSTLSGAADLFKGLLQLSSLKSGREALLELNKNSKWKSVKPLVKSFVRSTLFLLNEVTNSDILAFVATRLRASLVFFAAFPSQIPPLIKVSVHLWATGERVLSSAFFLVIRDLVAVFCSLNLQICLSKMFSALLSQSRVSKPTDNEQMLFLRDHFVQLCSLDVETSSLKALASMNQLASLLAWGHETKKKEALRKICSWEFVNCLDIWVRFVGEYIRDYDIQQLCFLVIQIINGLARLFLGARYFPLRLRCIEWLNYLSRSSGNFIPLASLVLDIFEYKFVKEGKKAQNSVNVLSVLKLPKQYLKSKTFQEQCFSSAVEQLCTHFSQWSCHISFPDLAALPLIRLKKTFEITTTESLRRVVKRLIDQVEQNVEFVQRKRDEVSFSPHDHKSVDSFLELEKSSLATSFMQYYKSVVATPVRLQIETR